MHDPSFMALAVIVSEKMTLNKKVYADDDDDDDNDAAGKAVHMSRLCFAGETKMREAFALHCKSFSHFFNKKNCHI